MHVRMGTMPMEISVLLAIYPVPYALAPLTWSVPAAPTRQSEQFLPNTTWRFGLLPAVQSVPRDSTLMPLSPTPVNSAALYAFTVLEIPTIVRMGHVRMGITST